MTRIMSSMIFCTFSDFISLGSTSRAGSCRTGSPALTVSGKFVFLASPPRPKNHPALALQVWDDADFQRNGGLVMGIVDNGVAVARQKMVFWRTSMGITRCKSKPSMPFVLSLCRLLRKSSPPTTTPKGVFMVCHVFGLIRQQKNVSFWITYEWAHSLFSNRMDRTRKNYWAFLGCLKIY